jgi:hypothetical protein
MASADQLLFPRVFSFAWETANDWSVFLGFPPFSSSSGTSASFSCFSFFGAEDKVDALVRNVKLYQQHNSIYSSKILRIHSRETNVGMLATLDVLQSLV